MRRKPPLAVVVAFGIAVCAGLAPRLRAEAQVSREAGVVNVTGASVAEMAGFVVSVLQASGAVPDWLQTKTVEGRVQRLSATDSFVVLARTMWQWEVEGRLPDSVPVAAGAVSAPVLAVSDLPEGIDGEAEPRLIPTDLFVAQSAEVVRWLGQFRMVPAAVWVDRARLAAQDYMAGMAIAIDYAYRNSQVEPAMAVARFLPPPAWTAHTESLAEYVEEEAVAGEGGIPEEVYPPSGAPEPAEASPPPMAPMLSLLPEAKAPVTGVVELVVSYAGPAPKFVTFLVDQQVKAIMNVSPYRYRWDTSRLTPGEHRVTVRVLGDNELELAVVEATYTVVAPAPPATEAEQ